MREFAKAGEIPRGFRSICAEQKVTDARQAARQELLGSGTPETNHRKIEAQEKRELKRLAERHQISLEAQEEGAPVPLQIHAFAAQTGSFISFQKHGSIRRVLEACKTKKKDDRADQKALLRQLQQTNEELASTHKEDRQRRHR